MLHSGRSEGGVRRSVHMRRVLTPLKVQPAPPSTHDEASTEGMHMMPRALSSHRQQPSVVVPPLVSDKGPSKPSGREAAESDQLDDLLEEVDALWHAVALLSCHVPHATLQEVRNRVSLDLRKWDAATGASSPTEGTERIDRDTVPSFSASGAMLQQPASSCLTLHHSGDKENMPLKVARRVSFSSRDKDESNSYPLHLRTAQDSSSRCVTAPAGDPSVVVGEPLPPPGAAPDGFGAPFRRCA